MGTSHSPVAQLIEPARLLAQSLQSIMGATETRLSNDPSGSSSEMAICPAFSMRGVSARFLRIPVRFRLAVGTRTPWSNQGPAMATILPRRRADGTIGYMATIRLHSKKKPVYREAKTFSRRAAAEKWARAREVGPEDPAQPWCVHVPETSPSRASFAGTSRQLQHIFKWQRTKQWQLRFRVRPSDSSRATAEARS